jgi:hypothetical protein
MKKKKKKERKKKCCKMVNNVSTCNLISFKSSLRFEIKDTFGHKLRYKIKVTFGEISLKLCQTNWNVDRNNVNVVADELPSQITIYTFLAIDIWTRQHRRSFMRFGAIRQNGRLPVKLTSKVFNFTMNTPSLPESA